MPPTEHLRRSDIVFAFVLAVLLLLCWMIRDTVMLIYLSIVFAVVFTPVVNWVQRFHVRGRHPSKGVAVVALIAFVIVALVGFGFVIVPSVIGDIQNFMHEFPKHLDAMRERAAKLPLGQRLASEINPGNIESRVASILKPVVTSVLKATGLVANIALLIVMTAYFIVDGERSFRWSMSLVPREHRSRLANTLKLAAARMQKWLIGQAILMLILGSLSFVVFWALGIRYFLALALFAGLANFVPILGPIATVVLAGAVAAMDSWMKLVGVLVFYFAYQQVESAYLTPYIMKNTVELPAVSVILALAIGGALAGVPGAIIAVPTAALVATIVNEYFKDDSAEPGD